MTLSTLKVDQDNKKESKSRIPVALSLVKYSSVALKKHEAIKEKALLLRG